MSLIQLLILIGAAVVICTVGGFSRTTRLRLPLMLAFSVLAIFWLQPALPIRGLDFFLPTGMLILVLVSWGLTARPEERSIRLNLRPVVIIAGIVLALATTRLFSLKGIITPSRAPQLWVSLIVVVIFGVLFLLVSRFKHVSKTWLGVSTVGLILIFILLKFPMLTEAISSSLRGLTGQNTGAASSLDIRWLGFSYVAFRLIHTLRDRQSGRLPGVTLEEYFIYVLFFPAFTAGPIDRVERFITFLRAPSPFSVERIEQAGERLFVGIAKKFIVADLLAMMALNAYNAGQVQSAGWAWILLYAYAFQIFFDFSGYTDIAIGLAGIMGVQLPENFKRPYLQPNLTQFWNNWHMTLTQWFRAYFFNPLTRALRSAEKPVPMWVVLLITQMSTFVLIGLWHGISLNFIAWGTWHGLGLFLQNRYSDKVRPFSAWLAERPGLNKVSRVLSTLLTFHFVALGWVWFALPSIDLSLSTFSKLFGFGG
jgi:D-alanyl-lipoteichoic acid acyltransferase DltB (MBOAT superfamily)